jgi:hypothetical protein
LFSDCGVDTVLVDYDCGVDTVLVDYDGLLFQAQLRIYNVFQFTLYYLEFGWGLWRVDF